MIFEKHRHEDIIIINHNDKGIPLLLLPSGEGKKESYLDLLDKYFPKDIKLILINNYT